MKDITLNEIRKVDIELIRKWRNSKEVASYMYDESYISEQQQIKWYEKVRNDSSSLYWVIEYDNKRLGVASINKIDKLLKSCYWAFYLGDTSVRGAGIGAKVEFNVLQYVFDELKLNKLRCEVLATNDRVIKMHEKFGFRREAYYREHCFKDNAPRDVVGLALLNKEWQSLRTVIKERIYGAG